MMEPQIIEVSVAPGPLGILLNGDDAAHPALLEGFAPISTEGDMGDVERDGRVPQGSELIGVNEYDFEEWKLTFAEISQLLRETSHLQRTLRFRVALGIVHSSSEEDDGDGGFQEINESEVDDALGVRSLSPPSSTGTKSWSVKDLRSPRSIADPSVSGSSSPKYDTTNQESTAVTEEGDALRRVQVDVPAGPLGLNLDGTTSDKALVLGFVPSPDGATGPVELSGRVQPGSVLIEVNGEDVSKLPLSEIAAMLGALSGEPKQLIFQLPDPSWTYPVPTLSKTMSGSARTMPKFVQDMDKRRKLELALVLKFDSSKLARRECWFIVDANWMSLWVDFAARGGPLPGPITNEVLLQDDWETKVNDDSLGRPDEPREGLQITKHYRAVSPMVWYIFCQLHGVTPNVPVLARYVLDVYSERIRNSDLKSLLTECRLKAASLASDLLDQCEIKVDG